MVAIVVESPIALDVCPFCRSGDNHIETDSAEGSYFQVMCDNPECEATGPNKPTAQEAAKAWNGPYR